MVIDFSFLALAAIVFVAYTIEAATGFGSVVIALALGLSLYPLALLLPVLVMLDAALCAYLALRGRASIDRVWLSQRILPCMSIGLLIGILLMQRVSGDLVRGAFGLFVLIVSVRELIALRVDRDAVRALAPIANAAGLVAAGVMHGMFATGGPLLVYVLGRSALAKSAFRSTLAAVWLILDLALISSYAMTARIDASTLRTALALAPSVGAAALVGEWTHSHLDERRFRIGVFAVLFLIGASLIAGYVRAAWTPAVLATGGQ